MHPFIQCRNHANIRLYGSPILTTVNRDPIRASGWCVAGTACDRAPYATVAERPTPDLHVWLPKRPLGNDHGLLSVRGFAERQLQRVGIAVRRIIATTAPKRFGLDEIVPRLCEEKSMLRQILVCTVLVTMTSVNPANAQKSPPTSEKAKQVEALVNKAAALIDSRGKAAFSEFRVKDTEWFHGDTYLFVYDLQSNVLLNPAFLAREGTKVTGQKDANGKLFHDAMIQMAQTKGSGWVDYMSRNPGRPNHRRNGPT